MTYGEAKQRINFHLAADRSIDANNMPLIVYDAIIKVAMLCDPLSLVTEGTTYPLLRYIDNINYVRIPNKPVNDIDILDIDLMLCEAVVYAACMAASANRKDDFKAMMMISINEYQWSIFNGETNVIYE